MVLGLAAVVLVLLATAGCADTSDEVAQSPASAGPTTSTSGPAGTPSNPSQSSDASVRVLLASNDGDTYSPEGYRYVKRDVPSSASAEEALKSGMRALFEPALADERQSGLRTLADSPQQVIESVEFNQGQAVVRLARLNEVVPGAGTSNGGTGVWTMLSGTAFGSAAVESVEFHLDGSCEAFAALLQQETCASTRSDWSSHPLNPG